MFVKNGLAFGLLMASLLLSTPASAQTVRDGITAWQKGDFDAAIAAWRPLADKGNADAAFNLGQAYRLGKGVPIDLAKSQLLFEQAARKGHIDAATNLGILLFQSNNRTGAMRWLRQAAEGSEPRAMLLYGTALFNGDGVKADPIRAYAYVSRAAAQGLAPAKETLADLDEVMPLEQRQAGVKLAQAMLATSSPAAAAATEVKAKAASAAAPPAPKAPTPKIAAAAKPPQEPKPKPVLSSGSGGWRVQLGAFSSRGSAQALYGKLSGKLGGAQPTYVPVGSMTRLQVGPYASKASADAMCAKLKPQACFPVSAE